MSVINELDEVTDLWREIEELSELGSVESQFSTSLASPNQGLLLYTFRQHPIVTHM